ncbi:gamma-glutamyltransferase family protein [Streptomyces sp. 3211]|uniref:gamma-glutamyltransferase family protein n=1 Tax=Streptomyces sp. 3211 TaxID=1964449 RepID=UPI00214FCEAE|nr:gamma-glutamyltransferase family protein [Streptomyces sp. 3211]
MYARYGAVATSHPLAAQSGLQVLRTGGSAVDAAVAAAITLTVTQPPANDIGADLFALVWDGKQLHGLNASGRTPAALSLEAAAAGNLTRGWLSVTVPGAPAGWRDLHHRFGSLPFHHLFRDAIRYARDGHPVSPTVAEHWHREARINASLGNDVFREWQKVFTLNGRPPKAGDMWANPEAADTLEAIAQSGAETLYRGTLARRIAAHARRTGGQLSEEDLAAHESLWATPLHVSYRGHEVWELPPNSQGLAPLMALQILEGLPESDNVFQWTHHAIEATKIALTDTRAHVADRDHMDVDPATLLTPELAAARRALISDRAWTPPPEVTAPKNDTVYVAAVDANGVMVSLIQSTFMGAGSHVVTPGTGFSLQNRAAGMSLDPAHPNRAAGGKRPFHTIIPGFLTKGGSPCGPFGIVGAHMQPQGHVQLMIKMLDQHANPQTALDAPRWCWTSGRSVLLEPQFSNLADDLRAAGHDVAISEDLTPFGVGQIAQRHATGGYIAGSDPRGDGLVAAW